MAEIFAAFIWGLIEVAFALTGKVVIWALSFGRWRCESLREDESRVFAAAGSLSFVRDGRRVITTTGMTFAGIAFYIMLVLVFMAHPAKV